MNINAVLHAKIIKQPFLHSVVKGLFDEDEFAQMSTFIQTYAKEKREELDKEWRSLIEKKQKQKKHKYPAMSLHYDKWDEMGFSSVNGKKCKDVFDNNRNDILSLFDQKRFGKEYYTQVFFNLAPPDVVFPIHHDSQPKVWTLAYYLSPLQNTGTILYDTKKQYVTEVPWELNTGCAFCPQDNVSWHSYKNSNPMDYRSVLIINICRKIRKVR